MPNPPIRSLLLPTTLIMVKKHWLHIYMPFSRIFRLQSKRLMCGVMVPLASSKINTSQQFIPLLQDKFGLTITWNFFATGHGKSCVDGIGAAVKSKVKGLILTRAEKVNNRLCRSIKLEIQVKNCFD